MKNRHGMQMQHCARTLDSCQRNDGPCVIQWINQIYLVSFMKSKVLSTQNNDWWPWLRSAEVSKRRACVSIQSHRALQCPRAMAEALQGFVSALAPLSMTILHGLERMHPPVGWYAKHRVEQRRVLSEQRRRTTCCLQDVTHFLRATSKLSAERVLVLSLHEWFSRHSARPANRAKSRSQACDIVGVKAK